MIQIFKNLNSYRVAVLLSSLSLGFGIFRELLIVALYGFTAKNDELQLYLSIFYTIGLTIDAMRLSCLNLYSILSLPRMIFAASVVTLPFCVVIGLIMSYATGGLNPYLLIMTITGGYLNLMAAILITYKQRNNIFLAAQMINVMPNLLLIPGVVLGYMFMYAHLTFVIVLMTSATPIVQCILLLLLRHNPLEHHHTPLSLWKSSIVFIRHLSSMVGEQMYQMIARSAFYHYGAGYLSVFAIAIRIYSAARFILIDSFIGSKLAAWQKHHQSDDMYLSKMINLTYLGFCILLISLVCSLFSSTHLFVSSLQMCVLLIGGFYFSTLVRVVYFKINHYETNPGIVVRFALFELACALISLLLTQQLNYPILALLWIGYIAKPFAQLLLLRKRYHGLALI